MSFDDIGDLGSNFWVSLSLGLIAIVYAIMKFLKDTREEKKEKAEDNNFSKLQVSLYNDMNELRTKLDTIFKRLGTLGERISRLEGIDEGGNRSKKSYPVRRYKYDTDEEDNKDEHN